MGIRTRLLRVVIFIGSLENSTPATVRITKFLRTIITETVSNIEWTQHQKRRHKIRIRFFNIKKEEE